MSESIAVDIVDVVAAAAGVHRARIVAAVDMDREHNAKAVGIAAAADAAADADIAADAESQSAAADRRYGLVVLGCIDAAQGSEINHAYCPLHQVADRCHPLRP